MTRTRWSMSTELRKEALGHFIREEIKALTPEAEILKAAREHRWFAPFYEGKSEAEIEAFLKETLARSRAIIEYIEAHPISGV